MGLYLGVELVRDRETLEPATDEALAICERMLELGVVIQPTGDGNNVLKVKPPLCITRRSADVVVGGARPDADRRLVGGLEAARRAQGTGGCPQARAGTPAAHDSQRERVG